MGIRTRTPATHPGPLHPTLSFEDQRRTNARKHATMAMTIMSKRTLAVALLALIAFAAIADSVDAGRDLLHKGKHKKKMQKKKMHKKPPPPPKHKKPPPPPKHKPPPPPMHYKPKYYHPKKYYHHPPPPKHYSHSYSY